MYSYLSLWFIGQDSTGVYSFFFQAAAKGRSRKKKHESDDDDGEDTGEPKPKLKARASIVDSLTGIDFSAQAKTKDGKVANFKIASWNVNGLRAWLEVREIVCVVTSVIY